MKLLVSLCLLLALNVPAAWAQSGTRVEHHAMPDFLAGDLEGLIVGPVGELVAAPVGLERYFTPSLYVWALALDRDGRILAGAGDEGGVFRRDGEEFLDLAPRVPVRTEIETFPLRAANEALARIRAGPLRGAAVQRGLSADHHRYR